MSDKLTENEIEVLRAVHNEHGGWRPWNGFLGCAKRLEKRGLIIEAGITAMPPHVCYVITDDGEQALFGPR
jgi:DNA-binding PadR family transcriptional regulator